MRKAAVVAMAGVLLVGGCAAPNGGDGTAGQNTAAGAAFGAVAGCALAAALGQRCADGAAIGALVGAPLVGRMVEYSKSAQLPPYSTTFVVLAIGVVLTGVVYAMSDRR